MSDRPLDAYAGRPVLVTGGSGFLGRRLVSRLLALGARVVNLDPAPFAPPGCDFVEGDIRDLETVGTALGRLAGDDPRGGLVLHLAGKNSAPQSLVEPYETFDLNILGTAALLEACRLHPAPVTVALMSTAAVYEAPTGSGAISESAPLGPASPYAASKAGAETLVFSYHRSLGVPATAARLFNVYGPGQLSDAVIPSIIRQMLDGGDLRLGNTAAVRDFIFVDDAVDAFLSLGAAKASPGKAVNIGTGRGASIAEVVEILRRITGFSGKVTVDQAKLRSRDADAIVADTSRLRELTGWAPAADLERGLAATVAAARDERAS